MNNSKQENNKISRIKRLKNKVKYRLKDDFRSVATVEDGSIVRALERLYKYLFQK